MLLFNSKSADPHFNLALEEHLFETYSEDFLLMYRNKDSVIVGKHQNAFSEANLTYLNYKGIPLLRRFSGGGTVFHDLNNINFSFITTGGNNMVIDFRKFALPVTEYMRLLNIPAEISERNDILIGGKKVSGNAAHAKGRRALHHGTLLFDSNLSKLSEALKPGSVLYESKAVKSVRSSVANISPFLTKKLSTNEFQNGLATYLSEHFNVTSGFELSEEDENQINMLANRKYKTWEWNFGYSPPFVADILARTSTGTFHAVIEVKKGKLEGLTFGESHTFGNELKSIVGLNYRIEEVQKKLTSVMPRDLVSQILTKMFGS